MYYWKWLFFNDFIFNRNTLIIFGLIEIMTQLIRIFPETNFKRKFWSRFSIKSFRLPLKQVILFYNYVLYNIYPW